MTYLHSFREDCQTQDEYEDLCISLRLLGAVLRKEAVMCDPFTLACYMAVGCCPAKYLKRRAERDAFEEREVSRAIPDYDPAEARRVKRALQRRWRSIRAEMATNTLKSD